MRPMLVGTLLGAVCARSLTRVEDGQFTREYSRLYTALVLSMALGLFAITLIGALLLLRRDA